MPASPTVQIVSDGAVTGAAAVGVTVETSISFPSAMPAPILLSSAHKIELRGESLRKKDPELDSNRSDGVK